MPEEAERRYHQLDPHDVHTMPFTLAELLYLNDSTSALVAAQDYEGSLALRQRMSTAIIAVSFPLLDKLLEATFYLLNSEEPEYTSFVDIQVSISDLYLLREAAISQAKYGKYPVGLSLLKKICGILFGQGVPVIDDASLEKLLEGVEGLDEQPND